MLKNDSLIRHPSVLVISYEFQEQISGGIGRVVNGLSKALVDKAEIDIFRLENRLFGYTSGSMFYRGNTKKKLWRPLEAAILNIIKSNKYDVIHFLTSGRDTLKILRTIKQSNFPGQFVLSCHSIIKHEIGIRAHFSKDEYYESEMLRDCGHIHVLNETSRRWLVSAYPELEILKKIHIIPNAISMSVQKCKTLPLVDSIHELKQQNYILVACASRWSHGKGLEYLLEAIQKIGNKRPIKFILIGRKKYSWEKNVGSYVKKIDKKIAELKSQVTVFGWLNTNEINSILSQVDICVMPSELEYFPYSILEPMIAGVPIISSRLPCIEEFLEEEKECLYFESKNSQMLADQIIRLADNEGLRKKLAKNAQSRAVTDFSWEKIGILYQEFYQRIIKER